MNWTLTAFLPAAGLALLLAVPTLRAQSLPAAPGGGDGAATAVVTERDEQNPAGGANSGGGELPKQPLSPVDRPHDNSAPPIHEVGAQGAVLHGTSGSPGGGGGGGGHRHPHGRRRWHHAHSGVTHPGPGAGPGAANATAGAGTGDTTGLVTTLVVLARADGSPLAGVLVLASDASGRVLDGAVSDARGVLLLATPVAAGAALRLDAAGGALADIVVAAGSAQVVVTH